MTNLASAPAYGRPGVLLTGATGFLGGYLLKELVERTEMPIYCLTRSDGTLGARARLMDNLHFLFGADAVEAWPLERIAIVEGDLAKERFGLSEAAENNDGFTYKSVIFYNDVCTVERQRFTVAHELGHILLHNGNGLYNREPQVKDNPIEQEANVFASRLLAPACVLWGLGVTNAEQIAELCNISMQSAKFRIERLNKLYEREKEFRQKYGRSCFLLSPDERAVYEQFREYINEHRL